MIITYKKNWIDPRVSINKSLIEGAGMFANSDIAKNEKIVILGGNYTDTNGAKEARKNGKVVMQWDEEVYSYENRGDGDDYFVNHSCDPNMWMADSFTLVAKRDIKSGEELTADYVMWEADENFVSAWKCHCGSPLCRGRVTGKDWKKPDIQKRYNGHFSPLINKRIAKQHA